MDYVVLIKQVPDVSKIPENAWDKEKGTLKRGLLTNVINPHDLHALNLALEMRSKYSDSKVVCLSMGPPTAEKVLRYAFSVYCDRDNDGVNEGVLLTDRKLGGADTVATSYSLAMAIRQIEKDILKSRDYTIITGMQSVDGDTAQVPAQIAQELGIGQISYVKGFQFDNDEMIIERIGPYGVEKIVPVQYPVLLTATECMHDLRYPSFIRSRLTKDKDIRIWSANDISASAGKIGVAGSKTQVYQIYSAREQKTRNSESVENLDTLVENIYNRFNKKNDTTIDTESYSVGDKISSYSGKVFVFAEQNNNRIQPVSLELVSEAKRLAKSLNQKVGAILLGHNISDIPQQLIAYGCDEVHIVDNESLDSFDPILYTKATSEVIAANKMQILLFGATPLGRELAPRISYRQQSGLTADCTKLEIDDYVSGKSQLTAILKQTRPALGGNIMATILTKGSEIQMATVRPGVMKLNIPDNNRKGVIINYDFVSEPLKTKVISREDKITDNALTEADIIIAGGRSIGSSENFTKYLGPLAESLENMLGVKAVIGATRMAVENGFITRQHQVGQTGTTVHPKLYVAIGISGAVQHISGMQNSGIIVAINNDGNARIFNIADYAIHGDFKEIVPKLVEAINRWKPQK